MGMQGIHHTLPQKSALSARKATAGKAGDHFQALLDSNISALAANGSQNWPESLGNPGYPRPAPFEAAAKTETATAAYRQQAAPPLSGWGKYKEDQLLSTPGGDNYDLNSKNVQSDPAVHDSFVGRIGKDLSDGLSCLVNGVKSLFFGVKSCYRDAERNIEHVKKPGVISAIGGMAKNIGSALSLGFWHPDQEKAPAGFAERAQFVFSRLKHAVFGDLVQGVGGSAIRAGENLVLAGWNLIEIVPDATIGNVKAGRELTTAIFDNGQVIVNYLTSILPTGEAWLRVHATDLKEGGLPVTYNLNLREHYDGDERWRYIRNTPFRKTIETIGSLLADVLTVKLFSNTGTTSEGTRKKTG